MKQSRGMSLFESVANIAVGFGISLGAQMLFLPLLGVVISLSQNVTFAVIMTVISIARSYILRRVFEALHIRHPLSPSALAIIAERRRQIEVEGWTAAHDDAHAPFELARAGAAYALYQRGATLDDVPLCWPWSRDWWKPQDARRNLVKAGALILAELERFERSRRRPS